MAGNKRRTGLLVGCGLAASLAAADRAGAVTTTLFDSHGFELSSGYVATNSLVGSPTVGGAPASQQFTGIENYDNPTSTLPTGAVESYATTFPGQVNTNPLNLQFAELVANNADTDTLAEFYPQANVAPVGTTFIPSPGQNVIDIRFTLSESQATEGEPFFGIIAYKSGGDLVNDQIASLGIDATTGKVVGADTLTAAGQAFTATLSATSFYSYELQLNYATQQATLYGVPNGATAFTALGTAAFDSPSSDFSYAALSTFALSGDNYSGVGLFDDYSVVAVPEPATASLLVVGAAGALTGRRRRKAGR